MTVTRAPIKVTYRAVFKGPKKGILNPMGLLLPVAMEIEVYPTRKAKDVMWLARSLGNGRSKDIDLPAAMSAESMRRDVAELFASQESQWRMWADLVNVVDGDLLRHQKEYVGKVRPISPEEVEIRGGKVYLKPIPTEEKGQ